MLKISHGNARPSANAIAARLERSGQHQLLENNLTELRRRLADLNDEIRTVAIEIRDSGAISDRHLNALTAERATLEADIHRTRADLAPLRLEYSNRIREALMPELTGGAAEMLKHLAGVREGLSRMERAAFEIHQAGGEIIGVPAVMYLAPLEAAAKQFGSE
jgi:hypothetical protein